MTLHQLHPKDAEPDALVLTVTVTVTDEVPVEDSFLGLTLYGYGRWSIPTPRVARENTV